MSETIQLVLAPVFLLVAIGSLLSVVNTRLGRIVDRARDLEDRIVLGTSKANAHLPELNSLDLRMRISHWSINLLSIAALTVAFLVAALFFGILGRADLSLVASVLFILTMFAIMSGIGLYIAEVYIATRTVRVRFDQL